MIPKNQGTIQKDTQKSGNDPKRYPKIQKHAQKSTQNNGTPLYHDICKLPPRVSTK